MTLYQKYKDNYSIIVVLGFLLLTVVKAGQFLFSNKTANYEFFALVGIAIFLSSLTYVLFKASLKVKIGKKKISIKLSPLSLLKIQLRKENIENIEFLNTSPFSTYGGGLVHFGDNHRVFNFGGNKAMVITLKDGRNYSFISKELYNQKDEILSRMS
jgi:hypothetical protein